MTSKCWMVPSFQPFPQKLRVVLPVCSKDASLMLTNLDWQEELDGRKDYDCVISADESVPNDTIRDLEIAAWRTFSSVEVLMYSRAPNENWPNGPNWAFQHTARYMQDGGRSWFWMEADCVPLQSQWLILLNHEYSVKRKPIMGVIVKGMGHCNGTAIYPPNFPQLLPECMTCTDIAWDGLMKDGATRFIHDANKLMCHVWGIERGVAKAFGGEPAYFSSTDDIRRWVCPGSLVFHRAKDISLIEQLRIRRRRRREP